MPSTDPAGANPQAGTQSPTEGADTAGTHEGGTHEGGAHDGGADTAGTHEGGAHDGGAEGGADEGGADEGGAEGGADEGGAEAEGGADEGGAEGGADEGGAEGGADEGGAEGGADEGGAEGGAEGGMSMPEGDCEVSCVLFADCVVSDCSGFEESDAEDLRLAWLDACVSPAIATAFDMQETCEDKINFADAVQMGTLRPLCDSTTNRYCEVSALVCGEWPYATYCAEWYTTAAPGEADETEGASQECYKYHLNIAADLAAEEEPDAAMIAAHCAHSMGMADADGNAPCLVF
jgi:hypothetical protein